MNKDLHEKAVNLRREGLSYSEILRQIPVAKSTLSGWLHSVGLAKKQQQRLTEKKLLSARRGGARKREIRLAITKQIWKAAGEEMHENNLFNNNLWLAGVLLYWAEGSKEKSYRVGQQTVFSNSDPKMISVFLKWLKEVIKIPEDDIAFEIYIHKSGNISGSLNYWSGIAACDKGKIKVYFKNHRLNRNRKNTGNNYHGLLRIRVRRSSTLTRKISAWIDNLCNYWGVV